MITSEAPATRDHRTGYRHDVRLDVLDLGEVILPDWHPLAATDGTAIIRGFAITHPDGVVLFDTGVADDHELLNETYQPTVVPIAEALNRASIDERDVVGIVNSHLHFDHCGQNRFLPSVPVFVQRTELDAVEIPHYTIPEWACVDDERRRLLNGDEEIAPGLHVLSTPGHTPGHQSMLIDDDDGRIILVGQACYTCAQFAAGEVLGSNIHDDSWMPTALESLGRLRSLNPDVAYLSHDETVFGTATT